MKDCLGPKDQWLRYQDWTRTSLEVGKQGLSKGQGSWRRAPRANDHF